MGWPGPLTHLQFLAWQAWLTLDLERPGKNEMYLMQLTHEVAAAPTRVWGKDLPSTPLETYRIKFKDERVPSSASQQETSHDLTALSPPTTDPTDVTAASDPGPPPMTSSQESAVGLPPVVTKANRATLEARIAVAAKLAQARLEAEQRQPPAPPKPTQQPSSPGRRPKPPPKTTES